MSVTDETGTSATERVATARETAPLRIHLLAGFRVERADGTMPDAAWRRSGAKTLVKLLATAPGHRLHREELAEVLSPDARPASASGAFRKALHFARHALEPSLRPKGVSSYLRLADDIVFLVAENVWIDADHFEDLAERALRGGDIAMYEAALAAYPGELLPEDRYEDWAETRCAHLRDLDGRASRGLAGVLEENGADEAAARLLRRVLRADSALEDVHRQLMRLYVRMGSRHQALRQYQECRDSLRRELDIEPEAETQRLYARIQGDAEPTDARPVETGGEDRGEDRGEDGGEDATQAVASLPAAVVQPPMSPLVGRGEALSLLLTELERATEGRGNLILVGGEAGVGKSRLVAEAARAARARGALVLWGASAEPRGLLPYGPIIEALDGLLATRPWGARQELAARYPELARLVPTLATDGAPPPPSTPEGERNRLFVAIVHVLSALSATHPVLFVLDDLHAADGESIGLLSHLARAASRRRWLLVGTYREEDVLATSPFHDVLVAATRHGLCRRVTLLRLSRADCGRLVDDLLGDGHASPALVERVYALSLGNPLFAQELVRSLVEEGLLARDNGYWDASDGGFVSVPRGVRELVEGRVDRLGDDVRRVLALAATSGMEFSFSTLRQAARAASVLPETAHDETLLNALDLALEARLLDEQGAGYTFRHPLFRATLYERLSRQRRAHLHEALAEVLESQRPEDVDTLAYHYTRSTDAEKALIYLERAGDKAAAVYANDVARAHYAALVERLDGLGRATHAARVRERLGEVCYRMGRYDEALDALDRALRVYEARDDMEAVGRATGQIGQVHSHRGTPDDGLARIHALLEPLERSGHLRALAGLYAMLAHLCGASGRYEEELAAAERAAELAQHVGATGTLAQALAWRGTSLLSLGRTEEGTAALRETIPLAEAVEDLDILTLTLSNLGEVHMVGGAFDEARPYFERALAAGKRLGDPAKTAFVLAAIGKNAVLSGDWSRARANLEEAVELARSTGQSWYAAYPPVALAQLHLAEGDLDGAAQQAEECIAIAAPGGDRQGLRLAHGLLAERDLLRDRPADALLRLAPLLHESGGEEHDVTALLPIFALTHLQGGEADRALEFADQGVRRSSAEGARVVLVDALRVRALALLEGDQWEEAQAAIEEGLALSRRLPYPLGEMRLLQTAGLLGLKRGDPGAARASLRAALHIAQRLGARIDIARVERSLALLPPV